MANRWSHPAGGWHAKLGQGVLESPRLAGRLPVSARARQRPGSQVPVAAVIAARW